MAAPQDLPLMTTIAAGLSLAFICGLICSRLRIPPIVGYLFAGIMIGPYSPGYVADLHIAEELAEIGIILLMFGVGLHFSLKDLQDVQRIALPGAIVQISVATALGLGLSHLWGWPLSSGLLFGLALSVASTVVLIRALESNNLLQTNNGRIAIGWLIIEDLVMIFALVLIPTLAVTGDSPAPIWQTLLYTSGKIALFVAFMLLAGKRFLPWLLMLVAQSRSRELFTLAVFGMAVGVAFIAAQLFGVSFALGAFFAGMMIRESDMNHEVADRALPFQDAFAVLFFVAVGMLFNPAILIDQPLNVLAVLAVIMIGKTLAAFFIVTLFGYPLKTGLIVSSSLAQIGEFSFILVTLGLTYNLLPTDGRDLILAGALISIGLNPLVFYGSKLAYVFIGRQPKLSNYFNMREDDLSRLRGDEKHALRELAILVGHGRVGSHISRNIKQAHIDLVIVESNRERVEQLREAGYHAIAGDATHAETLQDAAISKAVAIIVAVPDPFEARKIVEVARHLKPSIRVLVRAHNDEEADYFSRDGVDLAITGPQEIGNRMVQYLNDLLLR